MVVGADAALPEADLKRIRQLEGHHPPDHDEAAATVEVVVQAHTGISVRGIDSGKPALRLTGGKHLPPAWILEP